MRFKRIKCTVVYASHAHRCIDGYLITGTDEFNFDIVLFRVLGPTGKSLNRWTAAEYLTGMHFINRQMTRNEAIEEVRLKMSELTPKQCKQAVDGWEHINPPL